VLQECLDGRVELPINPTVFLKLMEISRSPDASVADYANVISSSNSLAAKVISTVNSSWYGVRHSVYNILQATNLLGTLNVRILAINHCLGAIHEGLGLPKDILAHYQESALIKATAARYLLERSEVDLADQAFLAALMQDMALPIMHKLSPELYENAFFTDSAAAAVLCRREQELFGMTHGEAAGILAKRLGVTEPLRILIHHHHDRGGMGEPQDKDQAELVESALFAGLFPHMIICWDKHSAAAAAELVERKLGTETGSFETVLCEIQERFTQLSERIRPAAPHCADLPDLLLQATREMTDADDPSANGKPDGADAADGGKQQPEFDGMTGLLSHLGLAQVGSAALQAARKDGGAASVLAMDIDGLEGIYRRLGRDVTEAAIRHVAKIVGQTLDTRWIVGRHRAGEMVAIAVGLDQADLPESLAQALVQAVGENPVQAEGQTIPITLSAGGVHFDTIPSAAGMGDLLKMAEALMCQSQLHGGGKATFERHGQ